MNYYFFIIKYIINKEEKLIKYIQEKMKLKRKREKLTLEEKKAF